jgi:hypothetical protein
MTLHFILQRFSGSDDSTLGLLLEKLENKKTVFQNYMLEDEHRDVKVSGETRIDAGFYELKIQELDTPLTLKYRKKYPWFQNHIEITGLKRHKGVYLHIGNTDEDTDGCPLFGDVADNNMIGPGSVAQSTLAFKRWYERVHPHLKSGKKVFLEVRDENYLLV